MGGCFHVPRVEYQYTIVKCLGKCMSDANVMLWIDLETTDADVNRCEVIEVGAFLTDMNLQPKNLNFSKVYKPTNEGLERLFFEPVVVDMHSKSGLLGDCSRAV